MGGECGSLGTNAVGATCLCVLSLPLAPSQSFTFGFYLVVRNLYTPNHPDGDPARLAKMELSLKAGRPPVTAINLESQWHEGSGPSLCYYEHRHILGQRQDGVSRDAGWDRLD